MALNFDVLVEFNGREQSFASLLGTPCTCVNWQAIIEEKVSHT